MKRFTKNVAIVAFAAVAAGASAQGINVQIDGKPLAFSGQQPVSMNGRVFVPLRGVFEGLGAFVNYTPANKQIFAQKGDSTIQMTLGSRMAMVNGKSVTLDEPAKTMNGATLVPLRFVSEALGAGVDWKREQRLVAISTNGMPGDASFGGGNRGQGMNNGSNAGVNQEDIVPAFTVVPIKINNTLSSQDSRRGDRFTATVDVASGNYYGGIPAGSTIEGRVRDAKPQRGSEPGVLDLEFQRLRLPNGRSLPLQASLYTLDESAVTRDENGVLTAKNKSRDNKIVYAGYGAGAGILVGLLSGGKIKLENALIGGALGALVGALEKPRQAPSNVRIGTGTQLGIRLDEDLAIVTR